MVLIGCGGMGRGHAQELLAFGGFDLVASDPSPDARNEMRQVASAVRLYVKAGEMLEKEKPDLVIVASPAPSHCELTIAALEAGAHVLGEKSIAVTLEELIAIIAIIRRIPRANTPTIFRRWSKNFDSIVGCERRNPLWTNPKELISCGV